MDKELIRDIDGFIEENREGIFRDIARLVAIKSDQGEAEPGAPFGAGPAKVLALALEMAEAMGLETRNCEDMMGYAQLGAGREYLATITHLDTVPTGQGWSGDPYTMTEREGYIIGRGVMDDKGPAVLCLYALKYLKTRGTALRYPVRALLGINEETKMGDLEHYLKNYPAPVFCFSPDAAFPLCNGEKGILHGRIVSRVPLDKVVELSGGYAANAVPDKAEALVKAGSLESRGRVTAEKRGELWHLTATGIGGHASEPEHTVNAIGELVNYMLEQGIVQGDEAGFFRLLALLHKGWDGAALGIAAEDGRFSPLTAVGGVIGIKDGRIFQTLDCRYPTNSGAEKISAAIAAKAGELAELIVDRDTPPFYMEPDDPAVKACMEVYNQVTGEEAKPFTMGGGTYAREFPRAVSFGPEHKDRPQPAFAGPIHGVDEAASVDYLLEALKIYILALLRLESLEL